MAWAGWSNLGHPPDVRIVGSPAVAGWSGLGSEGTLHVFVRGDDDHLWHVSNADGWRSWENLGPFLSTSPAAVSYGPGRLDVFAQRLNRDLWWRAWRQLIGWTPWMSLGGPINSKPTVVSCDVGVLDVFARGNDNGLWHRHHERGIWQPWESWGGGVVGYPQAVRRSGRVPCSTGIFAPRQGGMFYKVNRDGQWMPRPNDSHVLPDWAAVSQGNRVEMFFQFDGNVYHYSIDPDTNEIFMFQEYVATPRIGIPRFVNAPAAISVRFGRLDLFANSNQGDLWYNWFFQGI